MKKTVLLAFVLVLLSTAVVARASTKFNVASLGADPEEGMVSVKAGDWIK